MEEQLKSHRIYDTLEAATAALGNDVEKERNMSRITAQKLYDRQNEYGEISGNDLHELFENIVGDPSPSGKTTIDTAKLAAYAAKQEQMAKAIIAGETAAIPSAATQFSDVAEFCMSVIEAR